ncbi:MAG: glycyl radical protein [Candidatus Hodarchaeales archaeon]|jgi:formate C-acetyltransferase
MVQILEKKETLLDRVLTVQSTQRVETQRQAYLDRKLVYSIDRDRIVVRVMKETEGEPMVTRKAKLFATIVRELPIDIFPDELIVGWYDPIPNNCPLPVKCEPTLEASLDLISSRDRNPIYITEEQKRELREELIPYWRGEGNWEKTRRNLAHYDPVPDGFPPELWYSIQSGMASFHVGHFIPNHEKVLKKGFLGIKKEAEERLARIDQTDPEDVKKIPFLEGVITAMGAAAEIGKRFAARARELAKEEVDTKRRAELLKISEVCSWVPANPARTFYEAIQSVWFTHILHWWETRETASVSPGRMDQYLYPYFEADIREERITKWEVQELIDCFLLRPNWFLYHVNSLGGFLLTDTAGIAQHIDVGGLKADGTDATNELSYMILEGMMHIRLVEPDVGVLVHSRTPEDLLIKACQLCALGTGQPIFLNNDTIVVNLLGRGNLGGGPPITLEIARKASAMGCNEPTLMGMDSGYTTSVHFQTMPGVILAVLTNGRKGFPGGLVGPQTGDPRKFKSFEELQEAYRKQLAWAFERETIGSNIGERLMAEFEPTVFQSALIDDCIEKGICREAGGARYNFGPFVGGNGGPDAGNSLTAIKKLVFDEKKITMDQLCDALEKNFEGYDDLRQMLLRAPKFGNDDDYADEQTAWVMHTFSQESIKLENTRGGHKIPVLIPLSSYVRAGEAVGALPSGRLAGEPLTDSIAPTQGTDVNGLTAVLKSVGKVDSAEIFAGITFNLRLDPLIFKDDYGFKRMADLIRTFVDQKLHHVQFNVVSSDTLKAAQKEPDKYKDLMVRVAGYVARFIELPKAIQDTIITRTVHGL